jgi:hypothetical protein
MLEGRAQLRLEQPGPGSFDPLVSLSPWFDALAEAPHLVLCEVVLELGKELEDLLVAGDMVLLLLEPTQVVLKKDRMRIQYAYRNFLDPDPLFDISFDYHGKIITKVPVRNSKLG